MLAYGLILIIVGGFLLYSILQNYKQNNVINNKKQETEELKKEIKSLKRLNDSLIETINEDSKEVKIHNVSKTKEMADKALEKTTKLKEIIRKNNQKINNEIKYYVKGKIIN